MLKASNGVSKMNSSAKKAGQRAYNALKGNKYVWSVFAVNFILWVGLITGIALGGAARNLYLFEYKTTSRTVNMNKGVGDDIVEKINRWGTPEYMQNYHKTLPPKGNSYDWWDPSNIHILRADIFQDAKCETVIGPGGNIWQPYEVSPACNCLRNTLVELFRGVYNVSQNSTWVQKNKDEATTIISQQCLHGVRSTVTESLVDSNRYSLVALVATWNVVSFSYSVFLTFETMDPGPMNVGAYIVMQLITGIPAYQMLAQNPSTNSALILTGGMIYIILVGGLWNFQSFYRVQAPPTAEARDFRRHAMFWLAQCITLPSMAISYCMLAQLRNEYYVAVMAILAIMVSLLGFKSDYWHVWEKDVSGKYTPMYNFFCTVSVLYFGFGAVKDFNPDRYFSNAGTAALVCLQGMLSISIIQAGIMPLLGIKTEKLNHDTSIGILGFRTVLEVLFRALFTFAVLVDVVSVANMQDNISISG